MSAFISNLKAAVPFPGLVSETHEIDRNRKVLCPVHDDHVPSCHIYPDGFKCFSCGAHGDAVDWLKLTYNLSTAEAIKELERRTEGYVPPAAVRRPVPPPHPLTFRPVDATVLEHHHHKAAHLYRVPSAMEGRGFTLDDLKRLGFAAYRNDAVFPIRDPDGKVLALKRRFAEPKDGQRYRYTTLGHGNPAWCSPDFQGRDIALIVEGELNGMACWLATPELAVMGVAGTGGSLHAAALTGLTVYCYADGDDPGQKARDKWAAQALEVGAEKVFVLDPWPVDACDLAGRYGRAALRERLT